MNFKNLEYFVAVAEEKSIRKAAGKLYISEQSLGENIHRLEEEIEATLIVKSRPLELTKAGEVFYRYALSILEEKEEMLSKTKAVANEGGDEVLIAVRQGEVPPFLPDLLAGFSEEYPDYMARIVPKEYKQFEHFSENELYFLSMPSGEKSDGIPVFWDLPAVLVKESLLKEYYPKNWKRVLEELRESSDVRTLEKLPFADWNADETIGFRRMKEALQKLDFHPKFYQNTINQESNFAFCRRGLCAAIGMRDLFLQMISEEELEKEGFYMIPLAIEGLEIMITISYLKGRKLSSAEEAFCDYTKEYFKTSRRGLN